jgi:two-component sensor histidine kinase
MMKKHHAAIAAFVYLLLLGSFSVLQLNSLVKDIIILLLFVPPLLAPALCKRRIYLVMLGVLILFASTIPLLPTTVGYTPHYTQLFVGIIIAASIGEILYRQTRSRRYAEESLRENKKQLQQALEDGQKARAALQNANTELEQRIKELSILNHIIQTLAKADDLQTALAHITPQIGNLFQASGGGIALLDGAKTNITLASVYSRDLDVNKAIGLNISLEAIAVAKQLVTIKKSLIIPHPITHPATASLFQAMQWEKMETLILSPLLTKTGIIGAIGIGSDSPGRQFTHTEIELAETIAGQIATAIENVRLYKQARQDANTMSQLLKEVNHRAGNNLTAIVGLLSLEQRHLETADKSTYKEIMQDLNNRVNGLATVHRMLSSSKWEPLLLNDLTERIIHAALQMLPFDKRITVSVSPSSLRVTAEQAHNLALLINELTTNCIKYALPNKNRTTITVNFTQQDDEISLEFRDDGPGFPEKVLHFEDHSVGYDLIRNITQMNLKGSYALKNDSGAVAIIRFKAEA